MKLILSSALLLLAFAANAQAPTPVPIPKEPHHHLILENEYVRVFRVSIPGHDATLLHQHDVPYIYVSLGPADVINAVQGKPEARIVMADGQVGYSPGHFAHIARTHAGSSFDNVTIELLHPQKNPRNICQQLISGPVEDCSVSPYKRAENIPDKGLPLFETDEVFIQEVSWTNDQDHMEIGDGSDTLGDGPQTLLVSLENPGTKFQISGHAEQEFSAGTVAWLPAGKQCSISIPPGSHMRFIELSFHKPLVSSKQ
jgi:hypothetical protein